MDPYKRWRGWRGGILTNKTCPPPFDCDESLYTPKRYKVGGLSARKANDTKRDKPKRYTRLGCRKLVVLGSAHGCDPSSYGCVPKVPPNRAGKVTPTSLPYNTYHTSCIIGNYECTECVGTDSIYTNRRIYECTECVGTDSIYTNRRIYECTECVGTPHTLAYDY